MNHVIQTLSRFGLRSLVTIGILLLLAGSLLVVSQDFQIFVELQDSILPGYDPGHEPLPQGVERISLVTPDGEELEAWRYPARGESIDAVGLILHGNGGTLRTFFEYQQWLAENGIISYGVDYRGYGRSTGWPSESGIYTDVSTLWEYAIKRENLPESRFVLVGTSLGSAPASYLAANYSVGALVLIGAFTSIPDVVGEHPVYFPLRPFIWHDFPTRQYVEESKANCAVFAHGEADTIIDFSHLEKLKTAWNQNHRFQAITVTSTLAGHMNIFQSEEAQITAALLGCLGTSRK